MGAAMIYSPHYETMPREELGQLQLERLQTSVNRAYKSVPFYRRRLDELDLQPEDIQSAGDLSKLPFTTKEDLRRSYPYDMVAVPLREVVRFHLSSGTTGAPTVIAYTANDLRHWTELVARNLAAGGVTRDDVVQVFFGYGMFSGGFGLHQGAEAIGASVLPLSSAELLQQVKMMLDFRTTALVGMPSYALSIAQAVDDAGLDRNSLSLRVGLFGSEPWSERTRAEIESRLCIRAYDIYGLGEMGGPGVSGECPERNGLHLAEDHFLVEVIDPTSGSVLPDGETGELVFTTLTKEALPLLRYRSGDLSWLDASPCPCGRTTARMARVHKRTDDMMIVHGMNVHPDDVARVLAEFPEAGARFQIVAERVGAQDELEVRVELVNLPSDITRDMMQIRDRIARRLSEALGLEVKLSFLEPRLLRSGEGKLPRVIDNRSV
jgi:phenylacetate-CoA ligase